MRTYKVFVNKDGRYLVSILKNGDVDTTKMFEDARSWCVDSNSKMSNLRVFTKRHKELLDSKGFVLKEIIIKEEDFIL
jgi:hypothetical protein